MTFAFARGERRAAIIGLAAGIVVLGGIIASPARTWSAILIASFGLTGVGLGGLFFVALSYAAGTTWPVAIRRVPEAMTAAIPFGAAGLAAVFVLRPSIYPWIATTGHLVGFKGLWLSPAFFFLRAAIYLAVWLAFAAAIVRTSRAQDRGGQAGLTRRNITLSIAFIVVFALTFWLASFDWIMSLEPEWYSTIFGVYNFAGLISSAIAIAILLLLSVKAELLHDEVRDEHLHDLGKLLFAFSTFWMYIWFSQYMLIWYSNLPEEATYFVHRRAELWLPLFYLNVFLNWVVPFVTLLSRGAKRGWPLVIAALAVIAGRVCDLYLMVAPAVTTTGGPAFEPWELAPLVAAGALFVVVFARAFRSAAPVPIGDPGLASSLAYHS